MEKMELSEALKANASVFKNHENSSPSVVLLTGYSDDLSVNSIKRGIYLTNVYFQ